MSTDAEVVVVGAGPAGAVTAALLAAHGRDVLVLDRAGFPREKACAEYLSPGVVDALDRVGALGAVSAAGAARPKGLRIVRPKQTFDASYYDEERRPRSALGVPRPILDAALLDRARAAGARVRERVHVVAARPDGGGLTSVRVRSHGREERLSARFLVAADGLRSTVARALELDTPARWPRRLGLVARYRGGLRLARAEMHVSHDSYCGLAPVGDGLLTVSLVVPLGAKTADESTTAFFERRLDAFPGVAPALEGATRVTPIRGAAPLAHRVRRVAGPGFLLVGDAAGFLDPFTGEGVYRAIRGAELAADAAERALARADRLPVGYEQARRAAFADKERVCLLVQGFLSAPRAFDYALRRLATRPGASGVLCDVLGDCRPARDALRPRYVAEVLRP